MLDDPRPCNSSTSRTTTPCACCSSLYSPPCTSNDTHQHLKAYEKWLEILDKGIGETLEEAGVFDASFTTEEDDDDGYDDYNDDRDRRRRRRPRTGGGAGTNNLYDSYTNYGSYVGDGGGRVVEERGAGSGQYDPEGTRDERGLDYDDRLRFRCVTGPEDGRANLQMHDVTEDLAGDADASVAHGGPGRPAARKARGS